MAVTVRARKKRRYDQRMVVKTMRKLPPIQSKLQTLSTLNDITRDELMEILDLADILQVYKDAAAIPSFRLRHELPDGFPFGTKSMQVKVTINAEEATTRTLGTMVEGAVLAGGESFIVPAANSSKQAKGEGITHDTIQHAIQGADIYASRTKAEGAPRYFAETFGRLDRILKKPQPYCIPVINMGDGCHGHPTQGLGDARFLRRHWPDLKGFRLGLIGGIKLSRTGAEMLRLARKCGFPVNLYCQEDQLPPANLLEGVDWKFCSNWENVGECDVLYWIRPQFERANMDPVEYKKRMAIFKFTPKVHEQCKPDVIHMHAQPIMEEGDLLLVFPGMYEIPALNFGTIQQQADEMIAVRAAAMLVVWHNRKLIVTAPTPTKVKTQPIVRLKAVEKAEELDRRTRERHRAKKKEFFKPINKGTVVDGLKVVDSIVMYLWMLRQGMFNLSTPGVKCPVLPLSTSKFSDGWKGMVVLENVIFTKEQMASLQMAFPTAIWNVNDGRWFRKFVFASDHITKEGNHLTLDGLLPCPNPNCITNGCKQAPLPGFWVKPSLGYALECRFCERLFGSDEVHEEILARVGTVKMPDWI